MKATLQRQGHQVSLKRISRLMSSAGLSAGTRPGRINTTRVDGSTVATDLVKREFRADRPNQIWVADNLPFCKGIFEKFHNFCRFSAFSLSEALPPAPKYRTFAQIR